MSLKEKYVIQISDESSISTPMQGGLQMTSSHKKARQSVFYPSRVNLILYIFLLYLVFGLAVAISRPVHAATVQVAAGGSFQAALNAAQPGDTIELAAGETLPGPKPAHRLG